MRAVENFYKNDVRLFGKNIVDFQLFAIGAPSGIEFIDKNTRDWIADGYA